MNELILRLTRFVFDDAFTLGRMVSDTGDFKCYTCEDKVRDVKIMHETAIPAGTYTIGMKFSPHFKKVMPWIMDVLGFTDVYFHIGNGPQDTSGCILVGNTLSISQSFPLANSTVAMGKLMNLLDKAFDEKTPVKLIITEKR